MGGENVKNIENAQVREVWELFTKIDGSCPFTDIFDSSCYQFCFWIFLIAAAMGHRYENSAERREGKRTGPGQGGYKYLAMGVVRYSSCLPNPHSAVARPLLTPLWAHNSCVL